MTAKRHPSNYLVLNKNTADYDRKPDHTFLKQILFMNRAQIAHRNETFLNSALF